MGALFSGLRPVASLLAFTILRHALFDPSTLSIRGFRKHSREVASAHGVGATSSRTSAQWPGPNSAARQSSR